MVEDVFGIPDGEGVQRRQEEEIIGERGEEPGEQAGAQAVERRRGHDRDEIEQGEVGEIAERIDADAERGDQGDQGRRDDDMRPARGPGPGARRRLAGSARKTRGMRVPGHGRLLSRAKTRLSIEQRVRGAAGHKDRVKIWLFSAFSAVSLALACAPKPICRAAAMTAASAQLPDVRDADPAHHGPQEGLRQARARRDRRRLRRYRHLAALLAQGELRRRPIRWRSTGAHFRRAVA